MNCGNCREQLEQGASFCGNCGQKIALAPGPGAQTAGFIQGQDVALSESSAPSLAMNPSSYPQHEERVAGVVDQPAQTGPVQLSQPNSQSIPGPIVAPDPAGQSAYATPVAHGQGGTNGLAVTSLVLSIIGFLTGFIFIGIVLDIIAIILGIIGMRKSTGKGMAIAGVVIGAIGLLLTLLWISLIAPVVRQSTTYRTSQMSTQESSGTFSGQ